MSKKAIIWLTVGSGCFIVLACVAIAAALLFWVEGSPDQWLSDEPELQSIDVQLENAIQAKVGEEFVLEVGITNTDSKTIKLDSIDIESTYLEGANIIRVVPEFVGVDEISMFGESFYTYEFQHELAKNETVKVQFQLKAHKAGSFIGYIDICIDSPVDCNTYDAMMIVEE